MLGGLGTGSKLINGQDLVIVDVNDGIFMIFMGTDMRKEVQCYPGARYIIHKCTVYHVSHLATNIIIFTYLQTKHN